MAIFDDNFDIFERLSETNRSYNSNVNAIFYTDSRVSDISTDSDQAFYNFQAPDYYNQTTNSQYEYEFDIDSISDDFERDARRYSRGFENGVIY